MALVESWMRFAVCQAFPELPWLADPDQVTGAELTGMRGACRACGVLERCSAFALRAGISGGFWAGEFRDRSDGPDPHLRYHRTAGSGDAA